MTKVVLIFFGIILMLILLFAIIVKRVGNQNNEKIDSQYIDNEGMHSYYDRSMIEKREFMKNNPKADGLRTFKRLFGCHSTKNK